MLKYLKNKLGMGNKEVPASQQFYSPLRIGLHSTIDINTVDWIIMQEGLNKTMVLPSQGMTICAIGKTVEDGDEIFNIYLIDQNEEEFVLQLFCAEPAMSGDRQVSEATLYKQVVNIVPMSDREWDENMDSIGFNTIDLDGNTYNRVWGADHDGKMDLMEFTEEVVEHSKITSYTNNFLLYSRTFKSITDTDETELLLVGVEESDETAEITMMLGLPVPLSNINIQ